MMMMTEEEELPERALLLELWKEEERERRRLRDRRRRQSMSVQERENHLARRRCNYQLRRQRAANSPHDAAASPTDECNTGAGAPLLLLPSNRQHHQVNVFGDDVQCTDTATDAVVSDPRQDCRLDTVTNSISSVGLEVPAHTLAELRTRSRLSRVKRLARSRVGIAVDNWSSHAVAVDLIMEGSGGPSNCTPRKGLRLNRVKQLARGLNSRAAKAFDQDRRSEMTAEQDVLRGEPQHGNLPAVAQPSNGRCQDE